MTDDTPTDDERIPHPFELMEENQTRSAGIIQAIMLYHVARQLKRIADQIDGFGSGLGGLI